MHFFQKILVDLKVRYTVPYAKNLFESRTDSGTLYGIKKMLETFGLSISAIRVEDESDLQYPFIWFDNGWPRVIKNASEAEHVQSEDIILIVTDRGVAREPNYFKHLFTTYLLYALPFIAAAAALLLVIIAILSSSGDAGFDWHMTTLVILNSLGIFFSWRTVAKECSGTCHEVLESAGSKLFGIFSLGVIGLSYFIGSLFIVLFIPSLAPILALISCAALIMPCWSLSYQAFVVRSWCRNCLGVQAVVILTFVAELLLGRIDIHLLEWQGAFFAVALYIVVFYLCNRVYKLAQRNKQYPENLLSTYRILMKAPAVVKNVINQGEVHDTSGASTLVIKPVQPHTPASSDLDKDLTLDAAPHELFLVISPFCGHCRELFFKLREHIQSGLLNDYRIVLLFADEPAGEFVYGSAIALYQTGGTEALMDFLDGWYHSLKVSKYRKMSRQYIRTDQVKAELARQKEWFDKMKFHGTPVMLVDSHEVSYLLLDSIAR